jgi:hypothetical protein
MSDNKHENCPNFRKGVDEDLNPVTGCFHSGGLVLGRDCETECPIEIDLTCKVCDKTFNHRVTLTKHIAGSHKMTLEDYKLI